MSAAANQDSAMQDSANQDSVKQEKFPKVRSCNAALTNVQCSD